MGDVGRGGIAPPTLLIVASRQKVGFPGKKLAPSEGKPRPGPSQLTQAGHDSKCSRLLIHGYATEDTDAMHCCHTLRMLANDMDMLIDLCFLSGLVSTREFHLERGCVNIEF
jgi:hypothetical protein